MIVKIFSIELPNQTGIDKGTALLERTRRIDQMNNEINAFTKDHPEDWVKIEWLQSSAANAYGAYTELTAIATITSHDPGT
ncbi:MAG: hypothetical protein WC788_05155 [Candidatus Paceibacterota bacterium]|jgi:hypothetical protein